MTKRRLRITDEALTAALISPPVDLFSSLSELCDLTVSSPEIDRSALEHCGILPKSYQESSTE